MGKKGSWFSAIKRVFTLSSKEKPTDGPNKKSGNTEKKKGKGILRQGESKSLIPLFREPSSIEKILGEADQLLIRPPPPTTTTSTSNTNTSFSERPKTPPALPLPLPLPASSISPRVASPNAASASVSPKATSSRPAAAPPKVKESRKEIKYVQPTLRNQNISATKIQAAYRGYLARRSFRALKGLVRLQEVVSGQNVKRQTVNAMKQMQLLVRVQTQIQSRRIQMLENQHQAYRNDKDVESTLSKWMSEAGKNENWDDSVLTKEEIEARLRKKAEAIMKRERAMAYAYSHQLWKANPKSAHNPLDIRSNGFPWWWNWLERQLPETSTSQSQAAPKNIALTPPRPTSEYKPSPRPHTPSHKPANFNFDNHDSLTPRSSRSAAIPVRPHQLHTPARTPPSKPRAFDAPLKDDDSLMSCPPFSVPSYMAPTVSAKAKARANSNPRERFPRTPGSESSRRFSFPLTPNVGSFKWNKGGGSNKDTASQMGKHDLARSIGEFSVDSAVSMPALVGRKPFNRFV
ncbi:protein iq-domain 14 [Phtheirospermum japonicum]|uniref:Protein iq-domain 14 n=1 Tax=Phtheirospermum japonicum TaxID=374723 RepID=A0A830C8D5_9LAMI|nr:protein iq-domain 14 [Phtheirospermum japonicum]